MSNQAYWDEVYRDRSPYAVSWYRPRLEQSLLWIDQCSLSPDDCIVDIGGGASTLVDDLLARNYRNLVVGDISAEALAHARVRLGEAARRIRWLVGDARTKLFDDQSVALWHDRAVFHFLTGTADRDAYIAAMHACVRPGGFAIIATFGPKGPERCSGLPVVRYASSQLAAVLGDTFELVDSADEAHSTPGGTIQAFSYVLCRRL